MKPLIIFLLCLPALAHAQWDNYKCEPWQDSTEWTANHLGDSPCVHVWAVAEWQDVNKRNFISDLVYRPCGEDSEEKQARICEKCLQQELRSKTWGYKPNYTESKYKQLERKLRGDTVTVIKSEGSLGLTPKGWTPSQELFIGNTDTALITIATADSGAYLISSSVGIGWGEINLKPEKKKWFRKRRK